MSIDTILNFEKTIEDIKMYYSWEGYISREQGIELTKFIISHPEIINICEIGFNLGMSSVYMLNIRENINVCSFDLVDCKSKVIQKYNIDTYFPERHTLIVGNSINSLLSFINLYKQPIFDFIFIDGGHTDDIPEKDMMNSLRLLKQGGYMCIDDFNDSEYCNGVIHAYKKLIDNNLVKELYVASLKDNGHKWVYCQKL